jgi:hypothetical protein
MTSPHAVISGAITALETAGRATGVNLDPRTGSLCLNGALLVGAGLRRRVLLAVPGESNRHDLISNPPARPRYTDSFYRAAEVVARHLPPCSHAPGPSVVSFHDDPTCRIAHYNDDHCTGYEDALLVLKEALT